MDRNSEIRVDALEESVIDENDLKVLINTFVWMHAPKEMSLGEADAMACSILELFMTAREKAATKAS